MQRNNRLTMWHRHGNTIWFMFCSCYFFGSEVGFVALCEEKVDFLFLWWRAVTSHL